MNKKSPQLEQGYTRIAHSILLAMSKTYMSSYESQIVWFLLYKTYGFHKKDDWISNSQFVKYTNIHKAHVSRTIKKLVTRNIVTQIGNKIAFQKNWTLWKELPKQVTVTQTGNSVTQTGISKLPKQADTKDNITKDNITKDTKGVIEFVSRFNSVFGKNYRVTTGLKKKYQDRLKTFSHSELLSAVESLGKSKWHKGENDRGWVADPLFLIRSDEQVDKWRAKGEKFEPKGETLASMIPDSITNY